MPELGQRDRRAIAALAGLAPLASDSGRHRGRRRIWGPPQGPSRALHRRHARFATRAELERNAGAG
ncbi:MAG: transposase [Hyphomicrobiaceae bacterium]